MKVKVHAKSNFGIGVMTGFNRDFLIKKIKKDEKLPTLSYFNKLKDLNPETSNSILIIFI